MKINLFGQLISGSAFAGLALAGAIQTASANTELWIGVAGAATTTNWSDNANWSNLSGGGGPGPNGNTVFFGDLGAAAAAGTVSSVVDNSSLNPFALTFTNNSGNSKFHTVLVPAGIGVTNATSLVVGIQNSGAANYATTVNLVGGGTLVQNGTSMVIDDSTTTGGSSSILPTLDLSGLSNFVGTAISTLNIAGSGSESRGTGKLLLAQTNLITATNITMNTGSGNPSSVGGTIILGQTTNIINVTSFVVGQTKGAANVVEFTNSSSGLRIRGVTGADTDRNVTLTLGDRNNTGSGTTSGQFLFNGNRVDIKASIMLVGQDRSGSGTSIHAGSGTVKFDTGTMDVSTINEAVFTTADVASGVNATGNIIVGTNGTLIVGNGNLSLVNEATTTAATPSSGGLTLLGGTVICSNNIVKTSRVGFGGITNYGGTINMLSGAIGVLTNTVDFLSLSNATLALGTVSQNLTNVCVGNLDTENGGNSLLSNTIAIAFLPGIQIFPASFHLILYTNGAAGITTAGFNFFATGISGVYSYYLTNYSTTLNGGTVGLVDLVVTAGPVAKAITWRGTPTANWNTSDLDWLSSGNPTNFNQGDFVTFDDTATGGTTISLPGSVQPTTMTVSNTVKAYSFNGVGAIGGVSTLVKQGTNTLLLDNAGSSTFNGPITLSAGTVQVGNGDTSGSLGSGALANNGALIFNRIDTNILANTMSGGGGLTNLGVGSSLTVSGVNSSFNGAVMVAHGTLKLGASTALGTTNAGVVIANGATLDLGGYELTNVSVTAAGSGVSSAGAIINSGASIFPAITRLTLGNNTTFGGTGRWDLRSLNIADATGASLSTSGQAYNIIKAGTNTVTFSGVTVDPALANIDIQRGTFSAESATTSLGNPAGTVTVELGATLQLYALTNQLNKVFVLNGDGTNNTLSGANSTCTMIGPVTMNGSNIWNVSGISLTVTGPIGGAAPLTKIGSGYLILGGLNTYTNTTTVTNGTLALNGFNSGLPGLVTSMANTTIVGTGTNAGAVTVGGNVNPGDVGVAGTLTVPALTLASGASATFDLTPTTTTGGGVNDLLQVNGNLTLNNNSITINMLQGSLANGTYRLINYTGSLSGSFNPTVVVSGGATRYTFALNSGTAGQINLVVAGSEANVVWDGTSDNTWDVATTPNWLNTGTLAMDYFYQGDSVLLDDTAGVETGLNLTNAVAPSVITNSSSVNSFSITGTGRITGPGGIMKLGSSTLMLGTSNDFSGTVTVLAGTLQVTNNNALGTTNGPTIIASGATLDVIGVPVANVLNLGLEPIIVSGSGVGGIGAIINSGTGVFPQEDAIRNVTLAGDTWFGGPGQFSIATGSTTGRWDMRGTGTTLSTGGHPYNLYKTGNNQVSLVGVVVDTNLANIDIQQGMLGFEESTTSMGNPSSNLTVEAGAVLELYQGSGTNYYTKQFILNGNSVSTNIDSSNGSTILNGTMTLNNGCVIYVTSTALTNNCLVEGSGSLTKAGSGTLVLSAANTYSGNTTITGGPLQLFGTASIANSASVNLAIASAVLDLSARTDGTFTLGSGQTLTGIGTVNGNVTAGANTTIIPGNANNTTLTISNNLVMNGCSNAIVLETANGDNMIQVSNNLILTGVSTLGISSQSADTIGDTHTVMQYGGTLTGGAANLQVVGQGGFSYSLVDPSTTPGQIQVTVTAVPVNYVWRGGVPGAESNWDTVTTNWYDPNLGNMTNFISGVLAQFDDNYNPPYTNLNLVGSLNPLSLDFQDSSTTYTFQGSGKLTGTGGWTLESAGAVVVANTGVNDFTGDINIWSGGTLQIGTGGTAGNVGPGNINATNGAIIFDRSDNINIANHLNGPSTLTDLGTGVLTLSGQNSLSGLITVTNGTLQVNNNAALGGTAAGGLYVSPGATLDLGGQSFAAQAENLSNEVVIVSGSGVGGYGAIINSSTNSQYNSLRNMMVVGDVAFGGPGNWLATNASTPGRWDLRGSVTNCALVTSNMQPYSLYKIGTNHVGLVGVNIDSTPGQSLGNIYIQAGKLQIESGTTSLGDMNSNLTISAGATLGFYQSGLSNNFTKQFLLNGNGSTVTVTNESGTTTLNGSMSLSGGCIFGIGGTVVTNDCNLYGGGSLTLNGADRLVLSNTSIAYTGNTIVNSGTLQLIGSSSSIPPSPLFDISGSGAVLDVSGAGGTLVIGTAPSLAIRGGGTLRGSLDASAGGMVSPGESATIGTLTVSNIVTLGGSTITTIKVGHMGTATNDFLKAGAAMTLGGTLNITLLGGTPMAGDTFTLFKATPLSGTFAVTNPLPALTGGLSWVTTNLVNGIISVAENPSSPPLVASVAGTTLSLSWPTNSGWTLQQQANSLSVGLSNNWVDVPGSSSITSTNLKMDVTKQAVFYRLRP